MNIIAILTFKLSSHYIIQCEMGYDCYFLITLEDCDIPEETLESDWYPKFKHLWDSLQEVPYFR